MDLTPALIAATATLFAAGIAATVSFVVSVLSKEQKTSEFRQQWIDALREDMAELIGELSVLHVVATDNVNIGIVTRENFAELYDNIVKARMLITRIELRVNPMEHQKLLEALHEQRKMGSEPNDEIRHEAIERLVAESQAVLKTEWDRVKRGEPAFYWSKRGAIAILMVTFIAIGALVYRAW